MQLIDCKVELKLKWTNHCAQSADDVDNNGANPNNIIFTIKHTKLYILLVTLISKRQSKAIKNYSRRTGNDQLFGMNITGKNTTTKNKYFLKSNLVGVNRLFFFWFI